MWLFFFYKKTTAVVKITTNFVVIALTSSIVVVKVLRSSINSFKAASSLIDFVFNWKVKKTNR